MTMLLLEERGEWGASLTLKALSALCKGFVGFDLFPSDSSS